MISTEISPDIASLVETLVAASPGETVTYATLSEAIGRDIHAHRWMVLCARKIAARDHGVVFGTEYRVGLHRLTTDRLSTVGRAARASTKRKVRNAAKLIRQGASRANDISPEAGRSMNAELSALALIEYASGDKLAAPVKFHDDKAEPVAISARRLLESLGVSVPTA